MCLLISPHVVIVPVTDFHSAFFYLPTHFVLLLLLFFHYSTINHYFSLRSCSSALCLSLLSHAPHLTRTTHHAHHALRTHQRLNPHRRPSRRSQGPRRRNRIITTTAARAGLETPPIPRSSITPTPIIITTVPILLYPHPPLLLLLLLLPLHL